MDEFGSRIQHERNANMRTVPFVLTVQNGDPVAYSVLFPVK